MRVPIRVISMLALAVAAPACSDAMPAVEGGEDSGSAGESEPEPDPLEHSRATQEPAPVPMPIASVAELHAPPRREGPPRESDDALAIANASHAAFPAEELGYAVDDDAAVSFASGNTASNDFHDQFGHAIATGRFSSTLVDSLVVAAPYDDVSSNNRNSGKLYHFAEVLNTFVAGSWHSAGTLSGRAGWSLAVGDFDADGYDDLVAGMPWNDVGGVLQAGEVAIYRGGATGLTLWTTVSQSGGAIKEYGDRFGAAVAVGDFDNDGRADDLAVGSPGEDNGRGAVYVYRTTGGVLSAFATLTETGLGTRSDYEHFGATLAVGDIRGTSHDDLLVGAVDETVAGKVAGTVFLYTGANGTMNGAEVIAPSLPEHDQGFGRALAVGDFDHDGDDDAAIGSPGAGRTAGSVLVLLNTGAAFTQWTTLTETLAEHVPEYGDRFGAALATGDIDDDGRDDLVVGAPGEKYNDGAGLVFAFHVPGFLWSPLGEGWRSQAGLGSNESGDKFGAAVAVMRRGGVDLLVVGAPSETLGTTGLRSGAVFVYDGGDAFDAREWISQN